MREENPIPDNTSWPQTEKIELVKDDIFWPEGQWSFHCGDLVWSRTNGWQKYYEVKRQESHFKAAEEAMAAWDNQDHEKN